MSLYVGLRFFHLFGLAVFLFAHGVSAGASLVLRGPVATHTRPLLSLSQRAAMIANPGLLVVIVSGVWMAFLGSWWGRGWVWAAIGVLVVLIGAMAFIARPYYMARDAAGQSDQVVAERLRLTRPLAAVWIGGLGIFLLFGLMIFKPF